MIFGFYHKVLLHPTDYISSESGDGIKNYYALAYHIKHDSSYAHIQGVHYPYTEVHLFADGQPAIANPLKWIKETFGVPTEIFSIGLVNFLMLISFPISAVFLFLIFQKLSIGIGFSFFAAIGISLLAPQTFRITGHLGIAYSFFIPVLWWLYLQFKTKNKQWFYSFIIACYTLFFVFIHPYLGMIAAMFLLLLHGIEKIQEKNIDWKNSRYYAHIFIQALLPLVIFQVFVKFIDFHEGRTSTPWGMFFYNARLESILLPNHPPIKDLIELIFPIRGQRWEGWAYVGLSSVAMLFVLFRRFWRAFKNKRKIKLFRPVLNTHLRAFPLAGLILFVFASAVIFKVFPFILDLLPFLKQFRALGRFSWILFYMITGLAVYLAYQIYRKENGKGKTTKAKVFSVIFLALFYVEAIPYHLEIKEVFTKNLFQKENLKADLKEVVDFINPKDFQAIIPLPFFHIGSENFTTEGTDQSLKTGFLTSYHTSLPMLSAAIARTSIPEAKKIMQLFSPDYIQKEIEKDILSNKDFLLLYTKEHLNNQENDLKNKAQLIFENDSYQVLKISKTNLFAVEREKYWNDFKKETELLQLNNEGFYTSRPEKYFYYDDFENEESFKESRINGKCKIFPKGDSTVLWTMPKNSLEPYAYYKASLWFYNKEESINQANLVARVKSPGMKKGKEIYKQAVMKSMIIEGNWTLVELFFNIDNPTDELKIILKGDNFPKQNFIIDNFSIQPSDATVYKQLSKDLLFRNNHLIEKIKNY